MSELTPHLALPLLAAAQAQKHVTHNEALLLLDAAAQLAVLDRTRTAPPSAPTPGDRHIVAAGAGGDWAGHVGEIALYDSGWRFLVPRAGWRAYLAAERRTLLHDGTNWVDMLAGTPSGGTATLRAVEEELVLAGAFVASSIVIPNRAICLSVASRTVAAVTGATAYEVGIAGETSKFGGSLGVALGATNIGVIGPQAFYADTPLRITALGGAFTGGRVRLVLSYFAFGI
ncbi:conserved hypothetical protein [Ancylobacter novellus DSM 506]|uniref:Uncharacterized protein n=1 Tax=Ancylobacter novellus (strain ATCC 8093 / DSM 506 / JCM 20403 / CCM 1077 / IAM 12100 / NBRC 12443 / NCIMB 10456) TaxID=639283 RepID=D7A502_ANCN5|nr:DUF2793 domain-containing protein [Ancylobacter novellus]ADH88050.1 conserved hypothetical protein [Ancylobacter novellus DSM 506]